MDAQCRWYLETLPLRGAVVCDVGANVGALSSFFFEAVGPAGRVVSVEPLADNLMALRARVAAANAGGRWAVHPVAASSRDGEVVLATGSSEDTAHNAVVVADPSRFPAPGRVKVPCRALSSLAAGADVVKLDIEGHEYEALDEALPKLAGVKAWAVELHLQPGRPLSRAVAAFTARGYRVLGAGRRRGDASGAWVSAEVPRGMEWDAVPVAKLRRDGSEYKMLHVVAVR
ncbi:MAG: FkbM family methyltransferase [Polyangiales bacterium]